MLDGSLARHADAGRCQRNNDEQHKGLTAAKSE